MAAVTPCGQETGEVQIGVLSGAPCYWGVKEGVQTVDRNIAARPGWQGSEDTMLLWVRSTPDRRQGESDARAERRSW